MPLQSASIVADSGCVLTCPQCAAKIGTLRKALYQGWNFGLDIVKFEPDQVPGNPPKAECRKCGAAYSQMSASIAHGRQTWIHTQFGWLPPDPTSVADAVKRGIVERVQ